MSQEHKTAHYVDSGIPQPWHLVRPSPWPLFGALAAGLLTGGTVLFMHKGTIAGVDLGACWPLIGLAAVLTVMFLWWRDIVRESSVEKAHSPLVKIGLRYGMALFIASEVMFFAAFFWAYYSAALYPPEALGGIWPPANIKTFNPFDMPFIMTLILLLSGTTVTWAHHAAQAGNQKDMVRALGYTVLLGMSFSVCQFFEYHHALFSIKSGMYGATFFMATGFHGLHVIIGTIFLAVCYFRARAGHFTATSHFGLEAAAWYWHFVDVVWLFLFISIYWYGASPNPAP
ncbi:MAG: cytochrome c oxidase subunit 3 [Alphaproteobacteria bacterium]|nr:cytochrome c oxidase subunit 3 [Alphaproteobacteria bacterium]MBV8548509.1 cytochrome c oxidase subunit 3 [Alphaproteobacteria bacterium]